jgi:hypothetical protein
MAQAEIQTLVLHLKALANETRLKMLGLLADQERSVGELAALLDLKEPTISHHLAIMAEPELVSMRAEGNTHFYRLNTEALQRINKELFTPERISFLAKTEAKSAARKVLETFFEGERLTKIPDSPKKRLVILKYLANQFEEGCQYPEARVNEILKRYHPDCATLRRELIANKLMQRDHGVYWRLPAEACEINP